jgi:hypothetical protein
MACPRGNTTPTIDTGRSKPDVNALRIGAAGVVLLASLAGAGAHLTRVHPRLVAAESSPILRPLSICATQPGARFTTTTVGGTDHGLDGGFLIEPVGHTVKPTISARRALRNFHQVYGPTTPAEDRHTQVRFGLAFDLEQGPASASVIGYVPFIRRTRAWIVSNCVDAPSPKDYGGHYVGGTEIAIIADTVKPTNFGFTFQPTHSTSKNRGEDAVPTVEHPKPASTPYWSTRWTVAKRLKNGDIILRYQPRHCYTLDHVNIDGAPPGSVPVSVILSSGPHGSCPKPSATAPYVEIKPGPDGRFTKLRHERIGKARFEPENA